MTYLVSDKDMSELNLGLTSLAGLADDIKGSGVAYNPEGKILFTIVHVLRTRIAQWAKLWPMVDEHGVAKEIINSGVVAECAVHGLFYLDDKRGPKGGFGTSAVRDSDCPTCEREENAKWEAARDAKTDARVEEIRDREAGIQK